ncbi:hypothetical protein GCM10011410_01550 [Hoyosella rhizosphaerae]|uniref:Uncharacterized protein n=1 Tax=Hoyosella rhizosphaerae TaxID=1755582 RepID=A0A916X7Z6_9ACTN|nr:hypothetical protein GCM10011410_01550 [Hoyosella rhizosphaerae]
MIGAISEQLDSSVNPIVGIAAPSNSGTSFVVRLGIAELIVDGDQAEVVNHEGSWTTDSVSSRPETIRALDHMAAELSTWPMEADPQNYETGQAAVAACLGDVGTWVRR